MTKLLGERIKRKEDPRLIQGRGHYVDDFKLDRMVHMVFVRSPHAHARIKSVKTDAARAMPGVVEVFTGADLQGKLGLVPCAVAMEGLKIPEHPCLALGEVRYVGEPVVAVIASQQYAARDAADKVDVDYEPLAAVVDPEKALEKGAPRVQEKFPDNLAFLAKLEAGDWKAIEADANLKAIKARLVNQRLAPAAMEPRGVIASYSPGEDILTVWSSTQIPHLLKTNLAVMTGTDETRCRVIAPEVGGAFGSKLNVYGEEGVACFASKRLGRPVKWIEGRREATYIIERAMDLLARELKMDPVDVRMKNFPESKEFPLTLATGVTYDSANYQKTLKKVLRLGGYGKLRREQERLRKKQKYIGLGLSTYVEICAMGPSSRMPAGGWEFGTVRVERTGKATVLSGTSPHGQGEQTSFAQIVAEGLGIPYDDVTVYHGDTAVVPLGIGTFGSRTTAVGGTAIHLATERLKKKMARIAAHKLGVKPGELVFEDRTIKTPDGSKSMAFAEVVNEAYNATSLPPGIEPGLAEQSVFEPPNYTFPFGAHLAVVEVDVETGEVRLRNYYAVDDCGRVLNPMLVDGQIHGGLAQGIGQALWEEHVYDENGQLVTGTFMDYAVPKAHHFPWFETASTETRTPVNPLGVKGVGEAGTIASTPAIVNAVMDALAPFGVRHLDMPLKPEKIWRAIEKGRARRA